MNNNETLDRIVEECIQFNTVLQLPYQERGIGTQSVREKRKNLTARLLPELLRSVGIGSAILSFEGSGDSGNIEDSKYSQDNHVDPEDYWDFPNPHTHRQNIIINSKLFKVWELMNFSARYIGSQHTENTEAIPTIAQFVEWFGIYLTPPGFEINDGSSGLIAICTNSDKEGDGNIYVQTGWREVNTDTYSI